jgi:hypothetical protein
MMAAEVIDFNAYKPHMEGPALCLACKHKWQAVSPLGVFNFECPSCQSFKGTYEGMVHKYPAWECSCGCRYFGITPEQLFCINCGVEPNLPW